MIERIVYVSRAAPGIGPRDAYDIIRTAHNRNSRDGLTGALLFLDGCFLQVLEGDAFALDRRYAAIAADRRHVAIELRQRCRPPARAFPGEWMALKLDADVAAAVKDRFGYESGFPAERFSAERLVAFAQACCAASGG
jgi:Sensors of blue-light using FAD